jgi:hypothetical protein
MNLLAIDPGQSGGLALSLDSRITAIRMPDAPGTICREVMGACRLGAGGGAGFGVWLELVGGHIKGRPQTGSSMFKFGRGFGFLLGVLYACGVVPVLVPPALWQRDLGIGRAKDCADQRAWKRKLCAEAQRRFPSLAVTLATADALLILDYARGVVGHSSRQDTAAVCMGRGAPTVSVTASAPARTFAGRRSGAASAQTGAPSGACPLPLSASAGT